MHLYFLFVVCSSNATLFIRFFSHGKVNSDLFDFIAFYSPGIYFPIYIYILYYANIFFPYIPEWVSLTIVGGEREMENPECSWSWVITECLSKELSIAPFQLHSGF